MMKNQKNHNHLFYSQKNFSLESTDYFILIILIFGSLWFIYRFHFSIKFFILFSLFIMPGFFALIGAWITKRPSIVQIENKLIKLTMLTGRSYTYHWDQIKSLKPWDKKDHSWYILEVYMQEKPVIPTLPPPAPTIREFSIRQEIAELILRTQSGLYVPSRDDEQERKILERSFAGMNRLFYIGSVSAPIILLLGLYRLYKTEYDSAYFFGSFVVVVVGTLSLVKNKRKARQELVSITEKKDKQGE